MMEYPAPDWKKVQTKRSLWLCAPEFLEGIPGGEELERMFAGARPLAVGQSRAGVSGAEFEGRRLVIRETRKGGLLRSLRGEGFSSPARFHDEVAAWRRLKDGGVRTPDILALRLERLANGRWRGWVLQAAVEGETLEEALWRGGAGARAFYLEAARLAARMTAAGVLHRDYHPANVMVDAAGALWALDLDKARLYKGAVPAGRAGGALLRFLRYVQKLRASGAPVPEDWDAAFLLAGMENAALGSALEDAREFQRALLPARRLFWRPLKPPGG